MGCSDEDLLSPFLHYGLSSLGDGSSGVYHVVNQDCGLSRNVTYDVHDLRCAVGWPSLVNKRKRCIEQLCHAPCPPYPADVRRDDNGVLQLLVKEILRKDGDCFQIVHLDVKESLYLGDVQVEDDYPVYPCHCYEVCNKLCSDWLSCVCFPVLPGVAIVGDDCGYFPWRCPSDGISHYQKFHQGVVCWRGSWLDEKDFASPHALKNLAVYLAVLKALDGDRDHRSVEVH